ncbi:solute carrier family 22 member 13-like isoform X1 [Centropristis striata]|uniref:solute carrier family 22 member 13-like isoform X1 n=2 Tax=Centropristis striata TaxID=184440 RepID=UPI0027E1AC1D|nr:solute carrier family 22 member 13-like isoform X1 [Centropristis striata]
MPCLACCPRDPAPDKRKKMDGMDVFPIDVKDAAEKGNITIIFRSPLLTKYFLLMILAWFSLDLSIFCLYFNIGNLGLSIFMTQLLFGAIEIPAYLLCMWLLEVFGRKKLLITTTLTGGLCCILVLAVQGYPIAVTTLAVAARFFLLGAYTICHVYVQELFPTSVRQPATSLASVSGKLGALLAPLLNILSMYHWSIPTTVFSSLTLISGALCFLLPETRRKELPESTDKAENNRNVTSTKTENLKQQSTKL